MNSLKSEIKNHVTRLRPVTWKDLVDAAKVREMCVPETPTTGSSLNVQLELIQDQLKELTAQRSPSSASVGRCPERPQRSPSPRRVRFDDSANETRERYNNGRRNEYSDYVDLRSYDTPRPRYYDRSTFTTSNLNLRGRGMSRGYRNTRPMTPPSRLWRNDYYQQQPLEAPQRGRGAFWGGARLYRRENARGRQ